MRRLKQNKGQLGPKDSIINLKDSIINLFVLAIFFLSVLVGTLNNPYAKLILKLINFLFLFLFLFFYFRQLKSLLAAKKNQDFAQRLALRQNYQANLSKGPSVLNLAIQNKPLKPVLNLNKILSNQPNWPEFVSWAGYENRRLDKKKKYLQIAFNNSLVEAKKIIDSLPISEQVIIEVGTPLLKTYGVQAVSYLRKITPLAYYIVADSKVMDMGGQEVEILAQAGAQAITCLGAAPPETIDVFIAACQKHKVEAMIDMMNVEQPLLVLKKIKKLPQAVILHRGVDETAVPFPRQIPYYQIKQIKGSFNVLVSIAGGDSLREVQSAFFNDADIVVLWQQFMRADQKGADFARQLLNSINANSFKAFNFIQAEKPIELTRPKLGHSLS